MGYCPLPPRLPPPPSGGFPPGFFDQPPEPQRRQAWAIRNSDRLLWLSGIALIILYLKW